MGPAVIPLRFSSVESALRGEAFEHQPVATVCLNAAGQLLAANVAAAAWIGLSSAELIGRNLAEHLAARAQRHFARRWQRLWRRLQDPTAFNQHVRLQLADGRLVRPRLLGRLFICDGESFALISVLPTESDPLARMLHARANASGAGLHEGQLLLGPDRRVLAGRGPVKPLLGIPVAGAQGVPFEFLVDEAASGEFLRAFSRVCGGPSRSTVTLVGTARAYAGHLVKRRFNITLINLLSIDAVKAVLVRLRGVEEATTGAQRAQVLQDRLGDLAQRLCDVVILTDALGRDICLAMGVHALLGRDEADCIGAPVADVLIDQDRAAMQRVLRSCLESGFVPGARHHCLVRARTVQGDLRTLWVKVENGVQDPRLGGLLISAQDVSMLVAQGGEDRQSRQLEFRERLLNLAIQSRADFVQSLSGILRSGADALRGAGVGFWRLDRGRLVCEAFYSRADQRFLREWIGHDFVPAATHSVDRFLDRTPLAVADLNLASEGLDPQWARLRSCLSAPAMLDGEVAGIIAVFDTQARRWDSDETGFVATAALMIALAIEAAQRVEAEGRVEQLAWYDPLTGLPNRNLLRDNLRDALALAADARQRLALLLIDLDRFKDVNDSQGHLVGDAIIKRAAQVLREVTADQASTVARLGGDEFVVMVENFTHRQDIAELGDRITRALYRSDLVPALAAQVSASVGVALFPEHGRETGVLLKNADSAMYQAKRDGRNQVSFFNPVRHERAAREARVSLELMRAVQAETPQFFLEYQPQVEMHSRKVVGLEALLRWRHPQKGLIMPDRFVDVAESSGLSERITAWVLNEVCAQISRWRESFPAYDLPVSVNVPGRDFASNALPLAVRAALKRHQIEPRHVVLEVTERTLIGDGAVSNDVVTEFASSGVGLVLDDFGTGYCTLSYLRRLPIRAIKIDRSFVKNLPNDADGKALVEAIVGLASHFRLPVVAEGVETTEQADYLHGRGCEFAQGYLYSRPLPSGQISEQLARLPGLPLH